jgi:hypothetical protein
MHWLVPGGRKIKDGQPSASQPDALLRVPGKRKNLHPFIVRPAMSQCPRTEGKRSTDLDRAFAD